MPNMPTMKPNQIIALRARLGIDQFALAKLIKVSQSAVSRWEAGIRQPRKVQMLRLCALKAKKKSNGKQLDR